MPSEQQNHLRSGEWPCPVNDKTTWDQVNDHAQWTTKPLEIRWMTTLSEQQNHLRSGEWLFPVNNKTTLDQVNHHAQWTTKNTWDQVNHHQAHPLAHLLPRKQGLNIGDMCYTHRVWCISAIIWYKLNNHHSPPYTYCSGSKGLTWVLWTQKGLVYLSNHIEWIEQPPFSSLYLLLRKQKFDMDAMNTKRFGVSQQSYCMNWTTTILLLIPTAQEAKVWHGCYEHKKVWCISAIIWYKLNNHHSPPYTCCPGSKSLT